MPYRLGVDLGTTYTAAATDDAGVPTMVGLGNRALQVPSVLFWKPDGEFLVGETAEHRGLAQPDRVVREFKRRLGDDVPVLVAGTAFRAEELTARLLGWVVSTTTTRLGSPPAEVVVTHPANWGPYKLELLDRIGSLAGLEAITRMPEPVAAAARYATRTRVGVDDRLVVYDLGGGTFDVCVLVKTGWGFELLGTPEGVEHLGGVDFDEVLFHQVLQQLGDRVAGLDVEHPETTTGLARLRRSCVQAKEELSEDVEAVVPVALPGLVTSVRVRRAELEAAIRPALGETVAATLRAMRSAATRPEDLRSVVLVGGSSRIPLVSEMVQRELGVPVTLDTHPKHDIALGAVTGPSAPRRAVPGSVVPGAPGLADPVRPWSGHPPQPSAEDRTALLELPEEAEDTSILARRRRVNQPVAPAATVASMPTPRQRGRVALLVAAVAVLVVLVVVGYVLLGWTRAPGTVPGTPPTQTSATEPSTTPTAAAVELTDALMASTVAGRQIDDSLDWQAEPVVAGPADLPCLGQSNRGSAPAPAQIRSRLVTVDGDDGPSLVHQAEAYSTVEDAEQAFAATARSLGGCAEPEGVHIVAAQQVPGLGDDAVGLVVQVPVDNAKQFQTLMLARTGSLLDVVVVVEPDGRVTSTRVATALAIPVNLQCADAGGTCARGFDPENAPPPASGDEPFLAAADLPAVGDPLSGWDGGQPDSDPPADGATSGCEELDLAGSDVDAAAERRYQPREGNADVELVELVITADQPEAAQALVDDVRQDWADCAARGEGRRASTPVEVSGDGAEDAEVRGLVAKISASADDPQRFRAGVVAVGRTVVFLRLTRVDGSEMSEEEFVRVAARAGQRVSLGG